MYSWLKKHKARTTGRRGHYWPVLFADHSSAWEGAVSTCRCCRINAESFEMRLTLIVMSLKRVTGVVRPLWVHPWFGRKRNIYLWPKLERSGFSKCFHKLLRGRTVWLAWITNCREFSALVFKKASMADPDHFHRKIVKHQWSGTDWTGIGTNKVDRWTLDMLFFNKVACMRLIMRIRPTSSSTRESNWFRQ